MNTNNQNARIQASSLNAFGEIADVARDETETTPSMDVGASEAARAVTILKIFLIGCLFRLWNLVKSNLQKATPVCARCCATVVWWCGFALAIVVVHCVLSYPDVVLEIDNPYCNDCKVGLPKVFVDICGKSLLVARNGTIVEEYIPTGGYYTTGSSPCVSFNNKIYSPIGPSKTAARVTVGEDDTAAWAERVKNRRPRAAPSSPSTVTISGAEQLYAFLAVVSWLISSVYRYKSGVVQKICKLLTAYTVVSCWVYVPGCYGVVAMGFHTFVGCSWAISIIFAWWGCATTATVVVLRQEGGRMVGEYQTKFGSNLRKYVEFVTRAFFTQSSKDGTFLLPTEYKYLSTPMFDRSSDGCKYRKMSANSHVDGRGDFRWGPDVDASHVLRVTNLALRILSSLRYSLQQIQFESLVNDVARNGWGQFNGLYGSPVQSTVNVFLNGAMIEDHPVRDLREFEKAFALVVACLFQHEGVLVEEVLSEFGFYTDICEQEGKGDSKMKRFFGRQGGVRRISDYLKRKNQLNRASPEIYDALKLAGLNKRDFLMEVQASKGFASFEYYAMVDDRGSGGRCNPNMTAAERVRLVGEYLSSIGNHSRADEAFEAADRLDRHVSGFDYDSLEHRDYTRPDDSIFSVPLYRSQNGRIDFAEEGCIDSRWIMPRTIQDFKKLGYTDEEIQWISETYILEEPKQESIGQTPGALSAVTAASVFAARGSRTRFLGDVTRVVDTTHGHTVPVKVSTVEELERSLEANAAAAVQQMERMSAALEKFSGGRKVTDVLPEGGEEAVETVSAQKKKAKSKKVVVQESSIPGHRPISISKLPVCYIHIVDGVRIREHGQGVVMKIGQKCFAVTHLHNLAAAENITVRVVFLSGEGQNVVVPVVKVAEVDNDMWFIPLEGDFEGVRVHRGGVYRGAFVMPVFISGEWQSAIGNAGEIGDTTNDHGQSVKIQHAETSTDFGFCRAGVFSAAGDYLGGHHWSKVFLNGKNFPAFDADYLRPNPLVFKFVKAKLGKVMEGQQGRPNGRGPAKITRAMQNKTLCKSVPLHLFDTVEEFPTEKLRPVNEQGLIELPKFPCHSGKCIKTQSAEKVGEWTTKTKVPAKEAQVWHIRPEFSFEELSKAGVGLGHWHWKPGMESVVDEVAKFVDSDVDFQLLTVLGKTFNRLAMDTCSETGMPFTWIDPRSSPEEARNRVLYVLEGLNLDSKAGVTAMDKKTGDTLKAAGEGDVEKGKVLFGELVLEVICDLLDLEDAGEYIPFLDIPSIVFGKSDKYSIKKLEQKVGRSIQAVDILYKVLWSYFFWEHDLVWSQHTQRTDIGVCGLQEGTYVGHNPNTGWPRKRVARALGAHGVLSTDATGFDREMPASVIWSFYQNYLLCVIPDLPLSILLTLYQSSTVGLMVLPDNSVWRKPAGNLSGQNCTLLMNCVVNLALVSIGIAASERIVFKDFLDFDGRDSLIATPYGDTPDKVILSKYNVQKAHTQVKAPMDHDTHLEYLLHGFVRGASDCNIFNLETCAESVYGISPVELRYGNVNSCCPGSQLQDIYDAHAFVSMMPRVEHVIEVMRRNFIEITGDDNRTFYRLPILRNPNEVGFHGRVGYDCVEGQTAFSMRNREHLVQQVFGVYIDFWKHFLPWSIKLEGSLVEPVGLTLDDFPDVPLFCARLLVPMNGTVHMPMADVSRVLVHALTMANGDSAELIRERENGIAVSLVPNVLLHFGGALVDERIAYLSTKIKELSLAHADEIFKDTLEDQCMAEVGLSDLTQFC